MSSCGHSQSGWRLSAKRMMDVALAGPGLVVAFPLMCAVAIGLWVSSGSPVLFRQKRPGKDGLAFDCLKFRTMTDDRNESGDLLPDEERVTRLGRALRSTSLDELPQLWNVLSGHLSLVGPRPLLVRYLARYTREQNRRHEVLPGITGWAQVRGRNALSWTKKFELDVWYVDNWSLWLDIKILLETVKVVVFGVGVSAAEQITMPEFMGTSGRRADDVDSGPPNANVTGRLR